MTTDDLIPLLEQAGICQEVWFEHHRSIERFAALVAAEKEQQMIRDGWRYAKELEQSINALMKENARLVPKSLVDACIQEEREACARACEKMADNIYSNSHEDSQPMPHAVAKFCAAAIRARG